MAEGRFVSYLRVSTDRQGRSGLGLEAQRAAVAAFLDGGGRRLLAEFVEVESGRRSDRPQLAAALAACRTRRATLAVAKLDRLSRDVPFLRSLTDAGVDVGFCDMPHLPRRFRRPRRTQRARQAEPGPIPGTSPGRRHAAGPAKQAFRPSRGSRRSA